MKLRKLKWDSEMLDLNVAIAEEFKSIKEFQSFDIKNTLFDLIYVKKNFSDEDLMQIKYIKNKFFLQIEVALEKEIKKKKKKINFNNSQPYINIYKTFWREDIYQLVKEIKDSRFFLDKNIPKEKGYRLWKTSLFNHCNDSKNLLFVAEKNDKTVALGIVKKINSKVAYLYFISVKSEFKGKGIGSALIDTIEKKLCEENIYTLYTETQILNNSALNFYLRKGFNIKDIILVIHIWRNQLTK